MNVADAIVLLAYASLLVEMTVFPVPSEASTWQLLACRTGAGEGALARATRAPLWRKVLCFFVPTAIGVVLFLVPLCCILWPAARAAWVTLDSPALVGLGLLLVVAGRVTTFVATLQLRAQRRAGGGPPQGLFRWSRNPGLCGMFVLYIGLCLASGVPWLWLGLPLYVGNMHQRVLIEESNLLALHGAEWRDYSSRVPRYVGAAPCHHQGPGRRAPAASVSQTDVAAWFDATYRTKGLRYLRPPRSYPIFVQLLEARPGERLLDVACGPGLLLKAALERGVDASGIDLSREAVALAKQLLPGVDVQQGNAEHLPFADGTFDCVTCIGSIERFLDRPAALREMQRVAKPEARFCFLVRNASTLVWRVWRQGLGRRQVQGHQDARTLAQWRELFAQCGFVVQRVLPDQWPRARLRQLLPWWRPRPGRKEPETGSLAPLRWCNELVFVLRCDRSRA
ncbi:MAG TPA: methyltransferase domain-containing protein [Planctomycetota bacterium]|nr:methyltransferase domain-containing protein [Planctomycetota bacterium]